MKMNIDFWPKNPKANFLGNMANISSCKSGGYETDPDFWLKNPKPKTNPNKHKQKPRNKLRAKYWIPDQNIRGLKNLFVGVAVGRRGGLLVIVLMILLGWPEFIGRDYLSSHIITFLPKLIGQLHSNLLLVFVRIENRRTILRADVRALTIDLGEIVGLKEQLYQLLITCFRRVEDDLDGLCVAGPAGANLLIRWMSHVAASITDHSGYYAGCVFKMILSAPETAGCEERFFSLLFGGDEIQRNRIDTMTNIGWRETLT